MCCPLYSSRLCRAAAVILVALSPAVLSYDLDPDSLTSIKSIAKDMTEDMLSFYGGNQPGGTPGILPSPYYWWEAGAMMGSLIEYWHNTNDASYVNLTQAGLLAQVGPGDDYMPPAQNLNEGNDDQGFWGIAVMAATEYNFPNPPSDQPQWLALTQAVFNTMASRWEPQDCNGGLRWQIFKWNNGYDYKNSISQACLFELGARLALYTGNMTYADWATKTWDWMVGVKFIDENYYIYDGAQISTNCTDITPYQFSYNAGGFLVGAAAMWNLTEDPAWKERVDNLLTGAKVFFPKDNIMEEVACEPVSLCDLDEQSFKAYLSRWMSATAKWAPWTYDTINTYLRASAVAAAKQCVGGDNGRMCGLVWNADKYDGTTGIGQQMAAMETVLGCMVKERPDALTEHTGGTSKGNSSAGGGDIGRTMPTPETFAPITTGGRAGAAILSVLTICGLVAAIIFVIVDETSDKTFVQQVKGFHGNASASIAALAAAGGVAGAVFHRRDGFQEKEKGPATDISPISHTSSHSSSDGQLPMPPGMVVGHVRTESSGTQRRNSSMPLGWPHNPSLRGSVLIDPTNRRTLSMSGTIDMANQSEKEGGRSDSIEER